MSEKKSENYDPVLAPVPGVNQEMRAEEMKNLLEAGDPLPPKDIKIKEKPSFLEKIGIKIIR